LRLRGIELTDEDGGGGKKRGEMRNPDYDEEGERGCRGVFLGGGGQGGIPKRRDAMSVLWTWWGGWKREKRGIFREIPEEQHKKGEGFWPREKGKTGRWHGLLAEEGREWSSIRGVWEERESLSDKPSSSLSSRNKGKGVFFRGVVLVQGKKERQRRAVYSGEAFSRLLCKKNNFAAGGKKEKEGGGAVFGFREREDEMSQECEEKSLKFTEKGGRKGQREF